MTAGITGVFWLPRLAEFNSTTLNAGAHAIPISAASGSWGTLAAAWSDAAFTIARVMAEVGTGLQGVNGMAVLSRLTPFAGWASQQGALAAAMGVKCATNATSYTVASIAMPSLPEILATNAAVVASANPPGVVSGAFEVAEVVKHAMDIRAALVMETYEAATTAVVTTPGEFSMPPAIASGAGTASQGDFGSGDPISTAVAAVQAVASNPGVVSAVTQAANTAGGIVSSGVGTAGNIGASAIQAATAATMPAGTAAAPAMASMGGVSAGGGMTASAGLSTGGGLAAGGLRLPEGWGAAAGAPAAASAPAVSDSTVVNRADGAPVRNTGAGANPLMGNRQKGEDDDEHDGLDYVRADEFTDGRYVAEGVIGADLTGSAK
ncbi:PPE family protein [Nocardia lasii]|uniref:PPE family protein n=1 Tax=Nocardia lasii TaxID=1616107 RepID=A0ABW1JT02_9NOCA